MKNYLCLLAVLFLFIHCAKENESPSENEVNLLTTEQYKSIDNVDKDLLSLDIYHTSNTTEKKPIVVWVHGGGWSIGDKANKVQDKVQLFQAQGWLLVSVNYRLSPFPYQLNNPNRVKYPDHNQDVADALKWIYDNISQYGGDQRKMVLLGHSAGAHLVALTGTRPLFLANNGVPFSAIKGVAAIDTEGYDIPTKIAEGNDLYLNAFGPTESLHIEASPLFNIQSGESYPNFFIAKRGSQSRLDLANQFMAALETDQTMVTQVDGSIYSHAEINEAIGQAGESLITTPLLDFIRQCFE